MIISFFTKGILRCTKKKDLLLNLIIPSTFTIMATLKGRVTSSIACSYHSKNPNDIDKVMSVIEADIA